MAAPSQQKLLQWVVPAGETQVQYSPSALAYEIENFEQTTDGTLRTIVGPCPYEINRDGHPSNPGKPYTFGDNLPLYGIFQASLLGGAADLMIVRAGEKLFMHRGWEQSFTRIRGGLSAPNADNARYAAEPVYPDSFVVINEAIVWSNGIDQPCIIDHHGQVFPLGFDETPASLFVEGPQSAGKSERTVMNPNAGGYSWPGRIGTPGDLLAIDGGGLMAGEWLYYMQYEDRFGNLSGTSANSNPVKIDTQAARPPFATSPSDDAVNSTAQTATIDDLMRQFLVRSGGEAPEHAVAMRVYRTPDIRNVGSRPQFLVRIAGNREFAFPDGLSDSELGSEMATTIPTPRYRVACTHQGRLVVGNLVGQPGAVRRSATGAPGTFPRDELVFPDSGGAEVTAVASHNGALLAFTESSVYSLVEFGQPRPLAQGVGCVAPMSVRAMPDGTLVWLGRDGFYAMKGDSIGRVSQAIDRTIKHYVNKSRMVQATAAIHPITGEYRCALAPSGESAASLMLCFDGGAWRRIQMGMHVASMCNTQDWRRLTLFLGVKKGLAAKKYNAKTHTQLSKAPSVYVMDREIKDWEPPTRTARYRSGWLRGDETGLTQTNIRTMYIGMADAWDGDATIRFYKNGSWKDVIAQDDLRLIGPDDGSDVVTDIAGSAVIGSAAAHQPRMFWRQVPVGMENVNSWAFEITAESPTRVHLIAFAFDVSIATGGNVRSRACHTSSPPGAFTMKMCLTPPSSQTTSAERQRCSRAGWTRTTSARPSHWTILSGPRVRCTRCAMPARRRTRRSAQAVNTEHRG